MRAAAVWTRRTAWQQGRDSHGTQAAWTFWAARAGAQLWHRDLRRRQRFLQGLGIDGRGGASRLIDVCLDHGVSMFDSADVYSNGMAEEILGEAIKGKRNAC